MLNSLYKRHLPEGLFITESLLRDYAEVAGSFFSEIAGHFHDHENDFY